jgi:hypothetical protein
MQEPWTPGPWKTREENDGTSPPSWYIVRHVVGGRMGFAPFVGEIEHEADARLIAAAPEMAELLDKARVFLGFHAADYKLFHDITALLSRIRGEA